VIALTLSLWSGCSSHPPTVEPTAPPPPVARPAPEAAPPPPPPMPTVVQRDEVRGVWVTRWSFQKPEHLDAILDDAAAAGFTHVFLQVRGRFDAFYPSELEPWAKELTGTLGEDPGWDPLQHAIDGAHQRGLELHAWVNVYALWQGKGAPRSAGVAHPFSAHPDWTIAHRDGRTTDASVSYRFASPGNPEVRHHLVRVFDDLDERYAIDGLHLDYVRYPGKDWGHDGPSKAAAGATDDFDEWRREAIRQTVAAIDEVVDAPISAATWGVHEDRWSWGLGGASGYTAYFQDAHGMLGAGSLVAAAPMIYWTVKQPGQRLDFATLVQDHVDHRGPGQIWAGIDAHKLSPEQTLACIEAARAAGADGVVLFEYKAVRDKALGKRLAEGPFATPRRVERTIDPSGPAEPPQSSR